MTANLWKAATLTARTGVSHATGAAPDEAIWVTAAEAARGAPRQNLTSAATAPICWSSPTLRGAARDVHGVADTPPAVFFYHLERRPLEAVLPQLLERTLERGWRAVLQASSDERLDALDAHLWTYSEEGFLPHGSKKDGYAAQQPVYLTTGDDNPNAASVRFLVDGAVAGALAGYACIVYLFDGRDPDAVDQARGEWKRARAAGCTVTYWQQAETGRWEKRG